MTNNPRQKSQWTDKLRVELFLGRTWSDGKGRVYHCANGMLYRVKIFSIKKKRFPYGEIEFNRVDFLGFSTKYIT